MTDSPGNPTSILEPSPLPGGASPRLAARDRSIVGRSPGQLADDMHLSSGAMTNRLDRMEEAGLIRRLPDPTDRRGTLIEPTEEGHAAWDKTVGAQAVREALIAGTLTQAEREELHRLLRRLMGAFPAKAHWAEAPISAEPDPQAVGAGR